jgi:hypothetical protein
MKTKLVTIVSIASMGFLASLPASADELMIAGWDFSQYVGDGFLSIDSSTFTDTLSANYSNLDPTGNAGAESAQYGTMYIDGQFGSTDVPEGTGTEQFIPTAGSLVSNKDAPVQGIGDNEFDAHSVLSGEGQAYTQLLAMTANTEVDVVFQADVSSVGTASNWFVTFGAKAFSGTSTVGVDFSPTGSGYTTIDSVTLTATEAPYNVALSSESSGEGFVRLRFNSAGGQPIIDNVGVHADLAGGPCAGSGGDSDGDDICNNEDNCPYASNPGQADSGGIGNGPPDGIGDACQCGDVTGDGKVNSADATMIIRKSLGLTAPAFNVPCNCDVTDVSGDTCNSADATMITRKALGLSAPPFGNHCGNYTGACACDAGGNCLP